MPRSFQSFRNWTLATQQARRWPVFTQPDVPVSGGQKHAVVLLRVENNMHPSNLGFLCFPCKCQQSLWFKHGFQVARSGFRPRCGQPKASAASFPRAPTWPSSPAWPWRCKSRGPKSKTRKFGRSLTLFETVRKSIGGSLKMVFYMG